MSPKTRNKNKIKRPKQNQPSKKLKQNSKLKSSLTPRPKAKIIPIINKIKSSKFPFKPLPILNSTLKINKNGEKHVQMVISNPLPT
jgi:hypothetical protein